MIDAREQDLASLDELRRQSAAGAVRRWTFRFHAQRGSSPVIASKRLWDNIAALTEGTFETADALLDRLTDLVADLKDGRRPDREELTELADALKETREALAEDRAMFRRWMGDLEWVPTEA